jgi:hypothetical protein
MERITNIKNIIGKTISNAMICDCDESIAIIFTDESYAYVNASGFGECSELTLEADIDELQKKEVGIISIDEFNKIKEDRLMTRNANRIEKDLKQLQELKDKYESNKAISY